MNRWSFVFVGALLACGAEGNVPIATQASEVVYGTDGRHDVYDHPEPALQQLARESIVTLVRSSTLDVRNPDDVRVLGFTLEVTKGLCSDQRFINDPAPGFCSGTLIDDDLVLTAGHCIDDMTDCSRASFLFGFYRESATQLHRITQADVFRCRRLVVRQNAVMMGRNLDFAVVQLDRAATPRFRPAVVRTAMEPYDGPLVLVGSPSGIPIKIDAGGRVRNPRASTLDYFVGTTDAFRGNSGSGVFEPSTRELLGILVRGEEDFVPRGNCNVVNVCSETGCSGESSTYGFRALEAFCRTEQSVRLCGSAPNCGNGRCEPGETESSCAMDCSAPRCGDGRCNGDETSRSCSMDCGPVVPSGWTCRSSAWNGRDGCDCNCGVRDPDCEVQGQALNNCLAGQTCTMAGRCEDVSVARDGGVSDARVDAATDAFLSDALSEAGVGNPSAGGCSCAITPTRGASRVPFLAGLAALAATFRARRRRVLRA